MPRFPRIAILLLLCSLIIRVTWAAIQPRDDASIDRLPDQCEYLSLGRNLLQTGALSFVDPRFNQTIYAYRTPGYPAFIAMCGGSPLIIRLIQAVIDTSTILAIFLIARRLSGGEFVAYMAAILIAFNPFLIYFSGLILSETLFTSLLVWALFLLLWRRIVFAAIVLLAAIYVRPSAILLAPLLAGLSALNPNLSKSYPLMPALRRVAIVSAVVFIGLFPWAMRNHRVLGEWIWTTTNGGITLYDGFNPASTGGSDQRFIAEMPALQSMNEVARSQYLERLAKQWAADHPKQLIGLTIAKIARTWSPVPLSEEFGRPLYRIISAVYAVPFDLLLIAGLFSQAVSRRAKMLLLAPAIYFTVVHAMSVGSLRYRVPVEPELAVIAALITSKFVIRRNALDSHHPRPPL